MIDDVLSVVEREYGITARLPIEKLKGGYWNETYKLQSESAAFVVRIAPTRTRPEDVAAAHGLMRFMNDGISEVPRPIVTKSGNTFFVLQGRAVSVLPFLNGEMPRRGNQVAEESVARMLAKLHRRGAEFKGKFNKPNAESIINFGWDENANWCWVKIRELLDGGIQGLIKRLSPPIGDNALCCIDEIIGRKLQLADKRKWAADWLSSLRRSGRKIEIGPLHGDYYPGNVLIENEEISAVLDWDECRNEFYVFELARALWEFCRNDDDASLRQPNTTDYLSTYKRNDGTASEKDFDLILPLMKCIRVQEILFSLGEAVRGEWWDPEYVLYNFHSLEKLESIDIA